MNKLRAMASIRKSWNCWTETWLGMPPREAAAFYLGIPLAFAFISGTGKTGGMPLISKEAHYLWSVSVTLPMWWLQDLFSRIGSVVLRPWRPPLYLVLALGVVFALLFNGPLALVREQLFAPLIVPNAEYYHIWPWRFSDFEYLSKAVSSLVSGLLIWLPINYLYLYILRIPRYGYDVPKANPFLADTSHVSGTTNETADGSLVFGRLPREIGRDIVALRSEQHYTRVYTTKGEALLLMRLTDGIDSLSALGGLRVHRSYWVNTKHITDMVRNDGKLELTLSNGTKVPVSRSYKALVEERVSGHIALSVAPKV